MTLCLFPLISFNGKTVGEGAAIISYLSWLGGIVFTWLWYYLCLSHLASFPSNPGISLASGVRTSIYFPTSAAAAFLSLLVRIGESMLAILNLEEKTFSNNLYRWQSFILEAFFWCFADTFLRRRWTVVTGCSNSSLLLLLPPSCRLVRCFRYLDNQRGY